MYFYNILDFFYFYVYNYTIVQLFNLYMSMYTYIGNKLLLLKKYMKKKLQTFSLEHLRIFAVKQHHFELISP